LVLFSAIFNADNINLNFEVPNIQNTPGEKVLKKTPKMMFQMNLVLNI